jgi:hypothetical protein
MAQPSRRARLPQRAQAQLLVRSRGQPPGHGHLFDRDVPAENFVSGQPDLAHAAGAQRFDHAVTIRYNHV